MVLTRKLFSSRVGLLAALFVAILGGKFLLIERYGSEVPYWDQWDAEGDNLIRPYLEGRLAVAQFFAAHNEHRILFTRLQADSSRQGQRKAHVEPGVLSARTNRLHAQRIGSLHFVGPNRSFCWYQIR